MLSPQKISSLIPKKYRDNAGILTCTTLGELEKGIKKLNEQTSAIWFITAIAIYSIVYNGKMYEETNLSWRAYRAQTRERYGMDYQDFSEALSAGKFLYLHGKELFAAGWTPERSMRKLARADLALRICKDSNLVIEHLVKDQWIDFKAWYTNLKYDIGVGKLPKIAKVKGRIIEVKRNKVFMNGKESIQFTDELPRDEKKDILNLIRMYYAAKAEH